MSDNKQLLPTPSQASCADGRSPSAAYERLKLFLMNSMSMSHIYQPVMIRTMLVGGGAATRRQIAAAFLAADLSQLEYYEQITKGYPAQTLRRHGIVDHDRGIYWLRNEAGSLNEWERASLIAVCDGKVADYIARRQDAIWRHRAQNFDPIAGTLRYEILKRAKGRCEACGISNEERALQVDHIIPRTKGGSNDLANLQALCSACNAQKLDRDMTDFHHAHKSYQHRDPQCLFCTVEPSRLLLQNELAIVINDAFPVTVGHALVIPRRHISDQFDLWQPEVNAIRDLELRIVKRLRDGDPTISGFNIGTNSGASAGQTVFHCHLHVIPRRNGDVESPRGGIRGIIPEKQSY
jgi:diadenosine tetraphosphate (Ap4A) HIT family hydrolase